MSDRIRVIVKPVGLKAHVEYVENTLESFQKIVGGYIETVMIAEDAVIVCNEEGRLYGLPVNCKIAGHVFVGDIAVVGVDGDEFDDCNMKLADTKHLFR